MKCRPVPPLRHAATGILLPFWDTRVVPKQTLLEYLGADAGRFQSLFAAGVLTPPGGFLQVGETRPATSYIPAVIWASNGWAPPEATLRVLAAGTPELLKALTAAQDLLASVRGLITGPAGIARPAVPPPIPFAAAEA